MVDNDKGDTMIQTTMIHSDIDMSQDFGSFKIILHNIIERELPDSLPLEATQLLNQVQLV